VPGNHGRVDRIRRTGWRKAVCTWRENPGRGVLGRRPTNLR
jgi:hypothetical protein